jgi:integrase
MRRRSYFAEILGHSSPAITRKIYQHKRPDRLRAAVDTTAAAFDG